MTEASLSSALDHPLRRALIGAADNILDSQGFIDGAELAQAIGRMDIARLLYCCAFLINGFDLQARQRLTELADRVGLVLRQHQDEQSDIVVSGPAHAIALGELSRLFALDLTPLEGEVVLPPAFEPDISAIPPAIAVDDILLRMVGALNGFGAEALSELNDMLESLAEMVAMPVIDLRDHADANPGRLTELLVMRFLQGFLRVNFSLAYAPSGSAMLLHASARLNPAGLGAYFSNVRHLVRGPPDIIGMVRRAGDAWDGASMQQGIDRWSVLLSAKLSECARADLADAFADKENLAPLRAMLGIAAARLPIAFERELIVRIRDAGLDCNDLSLAAAAQTMMVKRANLAAEWVILGDIHATAGNHAEAEAAFARCHGDVTSDSAMLERIEALRTGNFAFMALTGGIHTPFARQRRRLFRWGAVPARWRGSPHVAAR